MASISKTTRRGTTRFRVFHESRDRNGNRVRRSKTFATFKGAQEQKRTWEAEELAGIRPTKATVARAVQEWLDYQLTNGEHRPETNARYRHKGRAIVNLIGHIEVGSLTPNDIEFLYSELLAGRGTPSGKPYSHKTLGHVRSIMLGVVRTAVRHRLLPFDVVSAARYPKAPPRKRKPPFTPDDVVRYLQGLDEAGSGMVMRAIAMTGLRRSEVGALMTRDVDFDRHVFMVRGALGQDGIVYPPKTANFHRRLPLTGDLEQLFRNQLVARKEMQLKAGPLWQETGLLFPEADGTPLRLNALTNRARRVRDALGLPKASPVHGLRHAWASMAISNGAQPKLVSAMLGHHSVAFTQDEYVDPYDHDLAEVATGLQTLLRGRGEG